MVDSRNLGLNQVFEIVELSTKICDALRSFMKSFDLSFGHFDFMCKEDGELVFLECNPDGMWVFYDDGNQISDAYAKFFKEKSSALA